MMQELNQKLNQALTLIPCQIESNVFFDILFEMNRYFDKDFVTLLHTAPYSEKKLNQNQRNLLRKYYYYGIKQWLSNINIAHFPQYTACLNDKMQVLNSFIQRCNTYDKTKIINSLIEKQKLLQEQKITDNSTKWLSWYDKKRQNLFDFSLFILDYCQENFQKDCFSIGNITKTIANIYDKLENYRHFVFLLHGKLFNAQNQDVSWQVIYKIGIFSQNFIQYKDKFFPFKKQNQTQKLAQFLNERFLNTKEVNEKICQNFYSAISTGFKFEDCLVSDTQNTIALILKKIQLDISPIPCPACMTTIQSGNSFPQMFLRSYECKNPSCPERSKSGRGKRFDLFGCYRAFKLSQNKKENQIADALHHTWRRDIFKDSLDVYLMLLNYYAFENETVCITKPLEALNIKNTNKRKVTQYILHKTTRDNDYNTDFQKLPIVIFFTKVTQLLKEQNKNNNKGRERKTQLKKDICLFNEDSTKGLQSLCAGQIGSAITSPPYYNAREYSQWQNMIMYFVDMLLNANAVYDVLDNDSYYLYNIGDIVNFDNVYVESNMSKRRLDLGFLSALVFEKSGFNLAGNIIWDKGEVQSKRNSTMNKTSLYVHCINCYEHIFVFKKGQLSLGDKNISTVKKITPVIKINCKGQNTYKHTAPYPIDLVALIKPFLKKDKYVLDPYLGSGTTLKWCKQNSIKGVGFEMDKTYFDLSLEYINQTQDKYVLDPF